MSTTVDQRVVEMRFDNRQFESNVQTSMSTIEKLKQKLNFTGASKGLDSISTAAKNVRFDGMVSGIDTVTSKFSYMQMTIQHQLNNIVDSCVNAGKKMASALTIDPIKSGFQEYETQINAVQTILANTSSKGTTLDQVNQALDELNLYADKTIYNFTEMTRNIGTFTAAGIDLETSVSAIQGIANLAAVSGSTSQQASTAMYQLSQALAAGTVKLMDWNSVVNAGMGGEVFQNALKETSRLLGTGADAAIEAEGSFRESLSTGWLTAEVLTETLKKMTTSGANEYVAKYTGLSEDAVQAALEHAEAEYGEADAIEKASEALAKKSGKNKDEIASVLKMARTAEDAATKVKTFSQLIDTLKESLQSGWTQTWEILIGDFEEAKELFTGISDTISEFINKSAETRNTILEGAMTSGWDKLVGKINEAGMETEEFESRIESVVKKHRLDFDHMIKKYGSLEKAVQAGAISADMLKEALKGVEGSVLDLEGLFQFGDGLDEASEDVKKIQKALEEAGFELEKFGVDGKFGSETQAAVKAFQEAHGLVVDGIVGPETLKALEEASGKTSDLTDDIYDLCDGVTELGGRALIIESFKNAWEGLKKTFGVIKGAWEDVFPPSTIEERTEKLYGIIKAVHSFSESLIPTKETTDKLARTFKGLFAALDIVRTIAGGGLKIAFEGIKTILSAFDMDILDLTANMGDAIVAFRDWLFEGNALAKAFDWLADKIPVVVDAISKWFNAFKETPSVRKFVDAIESMIDAFEKFVSGDFSVEELAQSLGTGLANALKTIPEMAIQVGKDFIAGFQNGISDSVSGVIDKIVTFCTNFVSAFAEALGVQSPSWKAYEIVVDFFQGAINAIKDMIDKVLNALKPVGEQIVKVFKSFWDFITDEEGNIEWGNIVAIGSLLSMIWTLKKLADAIDGVVGVIGGFADLTESLSDGITRISKAVSMDFKAKAVQKMAISLALLAASVWVIAQIDTGDLIKAGITIVVLAGILIGLTWAMDKMSQASAKYEKGKGFSIDGLKSGLLQIGIALLLLAATVKMIGDMDPEKAKQGFAALAAMAVGMLAFMAVLGKIGKSSSFEHVDKVGKMMTKLSIAMLLMVAVVKLAGGLSATEMLKGVAFAVAFAIFVKSITKVAKDSGENVSKVGSMMAKLSIAMLIMVAVVKLVGMLSVGEMIKGAAFAAAFVIFVKALVKSTQIGNEQKLAKIGGMMLSISVSLLLMVGVCKLIGSLSFGEMVKGAVFVAAFVVLLKVLVKILTISSEQQMVKVAGTIFAMSVAIGILAGVAVLLSMVDLAGLAKGITAVGLLSLMMTGMIKALKGAQNVKGAIMMMAIAIGVMAAAVVALTFVDPSKLAGATAALSILMGMFAVMAKGASNIQSSIGSIAVMLIAVAALAVILTAMSKLDVGSTIEIAASIGLLMLAMSASMQIISKAGNVSMKAMAPMGLLLVLTGLIGLMLVGLTKLNPGPTLQIAVALSSVLLAMSASALILSKIGPTASVGLSGAAGFLALVVAAGAILGVIGGLVAMIPGAEEFLNSGVPIMSAIGQNLGALIGGIIGGIGEGVSNSLPTIGQNISVFMDELANASENAAGVEGSSFDGVKDLVAVLGEIALTTVGTSISDIFTLGGTSMEKFQTDGVAFFTAMKEISTASTGIKLDETAMNSVILIATKLSELQSSLEPIGGVMSWFTGRDDLATFGTNIGQFISSMKTALSGLEGTTFNEEALSSIIKASGKLSELQSSLEPIGGVISWFTGRDDLATFGTNIGQFISSMKTALSGLEGTTFNEEALSSIIKASGKLSELQSSLEPIGGVISWFTGRDDLATFGTNIGQFISSMKTALSGLEGTTFNEEALSSIIKASGKLSELQSSLEPIGGVISWFTGRDDLATFGTNVGEFMTSMSTAFSGLGDTTINSEALGSIIDAATKLSELQSSLDNVGGVVDWFTGRDDLGTFGTNIGTFATAMGALKTAMGEEGITDDVITSITNTGTALTGLIDTLPSEGFFDGKMSLTDFSTYMTDFGEALSDFTAKASAVDVGIVSVAISTAYRIKYLIDALADLDASGVASFTGIGSGGFGADGYISDIAEAIADFSTKTADIDPTTVSTSVSAALRLKTLIAGLAGLDASGVENFKIGSIASSMKTYSDKVANMDPTLVSSSISAANRLKTFIAGLAGLDSSGVSNFRISSIGYSISSYAKTVGGIDFSVVSQSISAASRIKNFISGLAGLDAGGVSSFVSAINELGTVSIDSIVESFSGASSKMLTSGSQLFESAIEGIQSKQNSLISVIKSIMDAAHKTVTSKEPSFLSAGENLMSKLRTGVQNKEATISTAATSAVSKAVTSIRGYYDSFSSAGSYLGDGLVAGINAKQQAAYNAGYALGQKAVQGEKDGQASNSPSKLTIQAGKWLGEGLVIGIEKMGSKVYSAGHDLGDTAANSMTNSISKVSDLISGGMDTQPTIRPVLDLSDIESGVGSINSMFGNRMAIGASANLNVVSAMMSERNQNGEFGEVVSAINKLRKDLRGIQPTVNNINGITYDDGSNITDAVKSIIRAARMERRI